MTESIIQWNIRGLYHHIEGLRLILARQMPISVCLQETHLRPGQTPRVRGYKIFSKEVQPASGGRAHGGVGILIRDNVSCKLINLNTPLQAIAVRIAAPLQVTLVCIYLPDIYWSRGDLEQLLNQLPSPILLMGDFNSHNTWWGSNQTDARGRALEEIIDNTNLILLNNGAATHFNASSGNFSMIDLSFASPAISRRVEWTPMTELFQSDHYPIIITSSTPRSQFIVPERYDYRRADWSTFSTNLVTPRETGDVHHDTQSLTEAVERAAKASMPRVGGRMIRPPVPWWTPECRVVNVEKKRAFNRFKRYPTVENLIIFKRLRSREKVIFKKAKKESLTSYVSSLTTSATIREVWNKIRNLSGGCRLPSVPALLINRVVIAEPKEVAECFARHYQKVSSSSAYSDPFLRRKCDEERMPLDFTAAVSEYYNNPLTLDELDYILNNTRDTSPGGDGISYAMLKHLSPHMKNYLLRLYNRIWDTGVYPEGWREALIIPIPKEGKDTSLPSSYRPISLTTCLSKVLESIVNKRLVHELERRGFYSQQQAGFRKFHSTLDQLSYLEVYVQNAFMRREHVLAVFFDLEKAYDTTWRYGVLRKCHEIGLRGNLPRFLKGFLETRRFRVRLGTVLSGSYVQENGIPQGSVLSVTLFGMAVNNIADSVPGPLQKSLYVDDLAIFYSGKNISEIGVSMQQAIDGVADEAEKSGFRFSEEKTVCVHFCRLRKEHSPPVLRLNGVPIHYKDNVRFLGLIFDEKLTWRDHIEHLSVVCKKSLALLKFLSNYKWGADQEILKRIFIMVTCSKLEYGSPVYSSARKSRLRKLDVIYNQAIRIITGAFRTSPIPSLYVEAGIIPPDLRRERQTLKYVAGIWGKPHHFLHPIFFNGQYVEEYRKQRTRTRPVYIRALETLEAEEIELDPVMEYGFPPTPSWTLPSARVRLELASLKKNETLPVVYKNELYKVINEYEGYRLVFTDGSKLSNGVGCAVYTEGVTRSWTLPPYTTIYTAELIAICQALVLCQQIEQTAFLICSDSLSALTALKDKFSMDPALVRLRELLNTLETRGKKVTFMWVPGHVGVAGNEKADEAAKQAASSLRDEVISVRPTDIKTNINELIKNKWQIRWDAIDQKLHAIQPQVLAGSIRSLSRRENIVLTRLRIGHTRLTHGYLLSGEEKKRCPFCNEYYLTVYHLLEECQAVQIQRENVGLTRDMRIMLTDGIHTTKVFNFLKVINLYGEI